MSRETAELRLAAVVLAAGAGERLGPLGPKALLDWHGEPLVRRVVTTLIEARCVDPIWVTVGHRGADVSRVLADLPVPVHGLQVHSLQVDDWRDGQSASLRAAARHFARTPPDARPLDGLLVTLGDRPFVTAADYRRLVDAWRETPTEAITCRRPDGVRLPPAIFPAPQRSGRPGILGPKSEGDGKGEGEGVQRATVAELLHLTGDRGARHLLQSARSIELAARAAIDIDTVEDVERWRPGAT